MEMKTSLLWIVSAVIAYITLSVIERIMIKKRMAAKASAEKEKANDGATSC